MDFGDWRYDPVDFTLAHMGEGYVVHLAEITNAAQMLDWIFQIQGKSWATPEIIATLIGAFEALFDPQNYLCPHGSFEVIEPRQVVDRNLKRL